MSKEIPSEIIRLVELFERNISSYKSDDYKETRLREEFVNPMFECLGWDVRNLEGRSETYKDVIHEDTIKIKNKILAPDYTFRIGGRRIFFAETKKPHINIDTELSSAYQLRRYAWSAHLPLSILTNFDKLAIYDCLVKPSATDNPSIGRIGYYSFKEYLSHWAEISSIFSRVAITDGSFDKYVSSEKYKHGTSEVDSEFLSDIEFWRLELSRNIIKNNKSIKSTELNSAVQLIIDRLLFLRICEDRGIEKFGQLQEISSRKNIYFELIRLFNEADKKYNSGLFHFNARDGGGYPDKLTAALKIDDKSLKKITERLYYPSPYEFSVIPNNVIGEVYESFLTKEIKITANNRVVAKDKVENKKSSGIFYTPGYIADRIVGRVFCSAFKNMTDDQIMTLKILDPATGSGTFLVAVYKKLLEWYKDYYIKNNLNNKLYSNKNNENVLTIMAKKEILLKHIYGVDLDAQAVEVTKLFLLLTVLDGENRSSFRDQLPINKQALPDLSDNIKYGNSLLSPDFYDIENVTVSSAEGREVVTFDWKEEFKEIIENGGFDIIVGNPPYGGWISKNETEYFKKIFPVSTTDTAALFILRSHRLLKNSGICGMIVPKAFLYSSKWKSIRDMVFKDLEEVSDVGKVWGNVKLEQSIFQFRKNTGCNQYISFCRVNNEFPDSMECSIKKNSCKNDIILNGISKEEMRIGAKIEHVKSIDHDEIINRRGMHGIQKKLKKTGEGTRVIGGKQVHLFNISGEKGVLLRKPVNIKDFEYAKEGCILAQNIVSHITKPQGHIKIISSIVSKETSKAIIDDTVNQIDCKNAVSNYYIQSLLSSRLINWYVYRFVIGRAVRTIHFDKTLTDKIPFKVIDFNNNEEMSLLKLLIRCAVDEGEIRKAIAKTLTQQERIDLERKCRYLDDKLNELVYDLYGISDFDRKIINKDFT